jgi:hypothetical protein
MKIKHFALTALLPAITLVLTGCSTPSNANVQPAGKPGLVQGGIPVEIIQEPVTVVSVDAGRRLITLKHKDGSKKTFNVNESVNNFDQVKVGDTVSAAVKAELSIYILENGRLPGANGTTRPKSINFNAKVLMVNIKHRLLTLQFSNGQTMTIKASQDVQLEKMAPGNDVVMRSNEVTAITIKKS